MAQLITFYSDDFTGSAAVIEVLRFAGVPIMLFMDIPDAARLPRYRELGAIGIAGVARSKDPAWMKKQLPPVLSALKHMGAPVIHYKGFSTFDSAPEVGSIGVAAELGAQIYGSDRVALMVGAPSIHRYQVFGQLFVASEPCTSTTAAQINTAEQNGFHVLAFDAATVVDKARLATELQRIMAASLTVLAKGGDALVTTARGLNDPALARMVQSVAQAGISMALANERLGQSLGRLVSKIWLNTGLQRIAIAGGDTSGHAISALRATALSAVAPLAAGAPLCRVHADHDPKIDGLEVTLKGGQMGEPQFLSKPKAPVFNEYELGRLWVCPK